VLDAFVHRDHRAFPGCVASQGPLPAAVAATLPRKRGRSKRVFLATPDAVHDGIGLLYKGYFFNNLKRERGGASIPSQVMDESGCLPPQASKRGVGTSSYLIDMRAGFHDTPLNLHLAPYASRRRANRRPRCPTPLPLAGEGQRQSHAQRAGRGAGRGALRFNSSWKRPKVKFFIHKAKQNTIFDSAPTSFGDSSDQCDAFKLNISIK
jgi:hypothetical protein